MLIHMDAIRLSLIIRRYWSACYSDDGRQERLWWSKLEQAKHGVDAEVIEQAYGLAREKGPLND